MTAHKGKEEKRNRILAAAISVFARKGFFHAKISEIAQEAGVADGTIYLYFENKDHLLISIFEDEMDKIIRRFRTALEQQDTSVAKLRTFIRQHAEVAIGNPDLAHVLQVELRQSSTFMSDYTPIKFREFLELLEDIIREGQNSGAFRPDIHPGVIKRAIFGAIDELALHWILNGRRYDLLLSADQLADLFVEGLMAVQTIQHVQQSV